MLQLVLYRRITRKTLRRSGVGVVAAEHVLHKILCTLNTPNTPANTDLCSTATNTNVKADRSITFLEFPSSPFVVHVHLYQRALLRWEVLQDVFLQPSDLFSHTHIARGPPAHRFSLERGVYVKSSYRTSTYRRGAQCHFGLTTQRHWAPSATQSPKALVAANAHHDRCSQKGVQLGDM